MKRMNAVCRRLFLRENSIFCLNKRCLALVLLMAGLPNIAYLISLTYSEKFSFSSKFNIVKNFTKQPTLSTNTSMFNIVKNFTKQPTMSTITSTGRNTDDRDFGNILPQRENNLYYFHRLPFLNKKEYIALLPTCPYSPGFLVREKLKKYSGVWQVTESLVYPEDGTDMWNRAREWSKPNPLVDKNKVVSIVDTLVTSLRSRKYYLKKIHKVIQKPDPKNDGARFLLDLELGSNGTNQTYRLTEHVYQNSRSDLCFPEGMSWNKSATVYFIIPVKEQGQWVHHFIKQVTDASFLTGDTNFHVIVVDFESKDIDMVAAFNTSLLSYRHTIIQLTGKFYKTLALNKAAEAVPNAHDIIFLFDLHIDVPTDIMDSVRKNTIAGRMAYFPVVGRLDPGSNSVEHRGFWDMYGYGLLGIYKSDWDKFGGMNVEDYKFKWGGEDWDLVDRVLNGTLIEAERIKYPGLYHHYHPKHGQWN